METATHTPGPWTVNGSLIVVDCYGSATYDTDVSINFAPKRFIGRAESKANARLIATAPALLDALEYLVLNLGSFDGRFDAARAAIKQARGES